MSDIPEGYYLGPIGEVLVEFRRELNLDFVLDCPPKKKGRRGPKGDRGRDKRQKLIDRDGFCCHYCEVPMRLPQGDGRSFPNMMTFEHVVPRSVGGSNEYYNLVLACYDCNHEKDSLRNKCDCDFCRNAESIFRSKGASLHTARIV